MFHKKYDPHFYQEMFKKHIRKSDTNQLQYVIEFYGATLSCYLLDMGSVVLTHPINLANQKKPTVFIPGFKWFYVKWYNNRKYWILFNEDNLVKKIKSRLKSFHKIKDFLIFIKHFDDINDLEAIIIKLYNIKTHESVYTTFGVLSQYLGRSAKKDKNFIYKIESLSDDKIKGLYKWKHNKKVFMKRKILMGHELEKEESRARTKSQLEQLKQN